MAVGKNNKFILFSISLVILLVFLKIAGTFFLTNDNSVKEKTGNDTVIEVGSIELSADQLKAYYQSYSDPFVIHLRKVFDSFLAGKITGVSDPQTVIKAGFDEIKNITGLNSFDKKYYRSKFIVYEIDNHFLAGGKFIKFIFQDFPDKLFFGWVYKQSDGNFDLRAFGQIVGVDMVKIQKQFNKYLEDKDHAL